MAKGTPPPRPARGSRFSAGHGTDHPWPVAEFEIVSATGGKDSLSVSLLARRQWLKSATNLEEHGPEAHGDHGRGAWPSEEAASFTAFGLGRAKACSHGAGGVLRPGPELSCSATANSRHQRHKAVPFFGEGPDICAADEGSRSAGFML